MKIQASEASQDIVFAYRVQWTKLQRGDRDLKTLVCMMKGHRNQSMRKAEPGDNPGIYLSDYFFPSTRA